MCKYCDNWKENKRSSLVNTKTNMFSTGGFFNKIMNLNGNPMLYKCYEETSGITKSAEEIMLTNYCPFCGKELK